MNFMSSVTLPVNSSSFKVGFGGGKSYMLIVNCAAVSTPNLCPVVPSTAYIYVHQEEQNS